LATTLLACGSKQSLEDQLAQAATQWARHKSACPTYHYDRLVGSFTGDMAVTTVEITADRPAMRDFVHKPAPNDAGITTTAWQESVTAIGTHGDGFPAETVEQLLTECRAVLAHDSTTNDLLLTTDAHGVPTTCLFVPKMCVDDCGDGIDLTSFTCGPLAADPGP
jgi:hypothetical protein